MDGCWDFILRLLKSLFGPCDCRILKRFVRCRFDAGNAACIWATLTAAGKHCGKWEGHRPGQARLWMGVGAIVASAPILGSVSSEENTGKKVCEQHALAMRPVHQMQDLARTKNREDKRERERGFTPSGSTPRTSPGPTSLRSGPPRRTCALILQNVFISNFEKVNSPRQNRRLNVDYYLFKY